MFLSTFLAYRGGPIPVLSVALEVIIILCVLLSLTKSGAQISVSNGTGQCNFSGVLGFLLLSLSWDTGTPGQQNFFVPGQRKNGTKVF